MPEFFKIALLGAQGAGKTSFLEYRSFDTRFETTELILKNLFFTIVHKTISLNGHETHLELWEYNQGFSQIKQHKRIFQDLDAILLFFDASEDKVLRRLKNWMKLIKSNADGVPIFLMGTKIDQSSLVDIKKINAFKKKYDNIIRTFFISTILGFQKQKIYGALVESLLLAHRSIDWDCFYGSLTENDLYGDYSSRYLLWCFNRRFPDNELPFLPIRTPTLDSNDPDNSLRVFYDFPLNQTESQEGPELISLREEMLEELERLRNIMLGGDIYDDPRFEKLAPADKEIFKKFIEYFSACPVCGRENLELV
jgi:hypothetical protein